MLKAIIRYKKPETLKVLKGLAEYLDFEITNSEDKTFKVNGVTVFPGNGAVDNSEMEAIFSGKDIDAAELRKRAWQRGK